MKRVVATPRALAWCLGLDAGLVRIWVHRGVIGRVCDVRTHAVGYDVTESIRVRDARRRRAARRAA